MAVVEIPTHVCHVLDTHFCGETAVIGSDCGDDPFWNFLPCVDIDAEEVVCQAQSFTWVPDVPVELPLVPARDEAP